MKIDSWLSHKSDEWATPKYIYKQALDKGMFDPCPLGATVNGLELEWDKTNFVNPPYSHLLMWPA